MTTQPAGKKPSFSLPGLVTPHDLVATWLRMWLRKKTSFAFVAASLVLIATALP